MTTNRPLPSNAAYPAAAMPPSWFDRFGKEHSVIGWLGMYAGTIIVVVGSYPAGEALGRVLYRFLY